MSSLGTRIGRVVASSEMGKDSQMANIKKNLCEFPGIRLDYRGTERASGEMVHIYHLYIPKRTEARYADLIALIGDTFYQGNKFVIYKWIQREFVPTPEPTPAKAIGYKNISSTWGCPPLDPSIQVFRYVKKA